jgi:hypothetical protein
LVGDGVIDSGDEREVFGGHQIEDPRWLPAPSHSSAAMNVIHGFKRQIVVENPLHLSKVDAPGYDIGAYQDISTLEKLFEGSAALAFFHTAVE